MNPSFFRPRRIIAASTVAFLVLLGCSKQEEGARCSTENDDNDCDSGLECVAADELQQGVIDGVDRCCRPIGEGVGDSNCTRVIGSGSGGSGGSGGSDNSGGQAGETSTASNTTGQSCSHTSQCPAPTVCGPQGICQAECLADRDCAEGFVCDDSRCVSL